ncbi:MAG: GerAB/ArcD/ProY family transporter [Bacillota bacterium]
MRGANRINRRQAWFMVSGTMYGVTLLTLPYLSAEIAHETAWLPVVVIGAVSVLVAGIVGRLAERFPGRTVIEMVSELWGKPLGLVIGLAMAAVLYLNVPLQARLNSELLNSVLLPKTPPTFLIIALIVACVYTIEGGLSAIARLSEVLFPLTILITVVVFALGLRHVEFSHLQPMGNFPLQNFLGVRSFQMLNSFYGFVIILYLIPFMDKVKGLRGVGFSAVLVGTLVYTLVVTVTVAVLGAYHTVETIWPGLELARAVHIRGAFIERLDFLFLTMWIGPTFLTCVNLLFFSAFGIARVINPKNPRWLTWGLGILAIILALLPKGISQLERLSTMAGLAGLVIAYGLPILLYLTARVTGKGGSADEA